jgi:hypothetical protein
MRWWWRAVLFLGAWIFFESAISWLATCQPYESETYYGSEKNHCTLLHGPFLTLSLFVARAPIFLRTYEHELIAGFTIVLAVSTIGLWFSTRKLWQAGDTQIRTSRDIAALQARQTRVSIREFRRSADAADESAKAAHIQAKIASDALTQLERPYIFVFGVRQIFQDEESKDFYVSYTVANFGKLPAIIEGAWIDWVIDNRGAPPIPPLLHDGHNLMASPIMGAGERRPEIKAYVPIGMTSGGVVVRIENTGKPSSVVPDFTIGEDFDVFIRAKIQYRGPFTNGHETGALWLYNPGSFEFAVRGGEEDNYVK